MTNQTITSREIVMRAITFERPPRLPFWQHVFADVPDDVCDIWEMDRGKGGWFFDNPAVDDWGCGWARTEQHNMGQVVNHPLQDWGKLDSYQPPNPRDPFYFQRIDEGLTGAEDKYVVVTSHFNLFERVHMLHGFVNTLIDLYDAPEKVEKLIRMVLEWKSEHFDELHRRFGDRVHGLFLTDDWGTQEAPFVSGEAFEQFFLHPYRALSGVIHGYGWHFLLHSCGRINDLVPYFVEAGVDVMNMQQPRCYGIEEFGRRFAGKIAFLTTVDIQATLPRGVAQAVREEAKLLVKHWGTPEGGLIVFDYGDPEALGVPAEMARAMFDAFLDSSSAGTWKLLATGQDSQR